MGWLSFLAALPDLYKLWKAVDARVKENQKNEKTKEEVKNLSKAVNEKDIDKVNHIFNGHSK
jgi:cell fate (sporulation/competence/biofilm development) regulator YmcA (YheA/YmcA/DUF963 family)